MDRERPAVSALLNAMIGPDRDLARRLVNGDPWTAELATGNAALFFLLVRTGRRPGMTARHLNALARLPRTGLLAALGGTASASTERFLRRVAFHDLHAESERALHALVQQPLPAWARHSRRPHLGLLIRVSPERWRSATRAFDAVLDGDPQARSRRGGMPSVAELCGYWGRPHVRQIIDEIAEVLRLVDYGAGWLRDDAAQTAIRATLIGQLERCRTLADIRRVHQRVIEVNGHLWTESDDPVIENHPWPHPPIPGDDAIEPVASLDDLRLEGRSMHHCVATYAERIILGHGYVYRVHRPERATLYLGKDAHGSWCARELRGVRNRPVEKQTQVAVARWLRAAAVAQDLPGSGVA